MGYQSFIVSIQNNTNDTLRISDKNIFAIHSFEPKFIVPKDNVNKLIKLNCGWFIASTTYGVLSSFGYAGRKIVFNVNSLLVSVPFLAYGISNLVIAKQSSKKLKIDIDKYYLIGKKVMPNSIVSGLILVKSNTNDINFEYKQPTE